jgi:hypothetical protein
MNETLHPSTLGEILDRTAQLYRARFMVYLGIALVPTGAMLVLVFLFGLFAALFKVRGITSHLPDTAYSLFALFGLGIVAVALPVLLAAMVLSAAAMNHAVSRAYLGETATIRDAFKAVWRRGWRYLGLYLLQGFTQGLIISVIPVIFWTVLTFVLILFALLMEKSGMAGREERFLIYLTAVPVVTALICYGIWLLLRLSLAFPAAVIEQIGPWSSLKRSSALSKGANGPIFLLNMLVGILGWVLSMGIIIPAASLLSLIPGLHGAQHTQAAEFAMALIVYGAAFAVLALIQPVYGIALVLFYYDQRIRMEGFDIEWMMRRCRRPRHGCRPHPARNRLPSIQPSPKLMRFPNRKRTR